MTMLQPPLYFSGVLKLERLKRLDAPPGHRIGRQERDWVEAQVERKKREEGCNALRVPDPENMQGPIYLIYDGDGRMDYSNYDYDIRAIERSFGIDPDQSELAQPLTPEQNQALTERIDAIVRKFLARAKPAQVEYRMPAPGSVHIERLEILG